MISAYQHAVLSLGTRDFLGALAQNEASPTVDLPLPSKDPSWFIRAITINSVQNLAWELWLFSSATNLGGTVDTENLIAMWAFTEIMAQAPGYPVTPHGGVLDPLYHYYVDGNMMPYRDVDFMKYSQASSIASNVRPQSPNAMLHCRLINRSATGKNADDAGAVQVTFWVATQGMQV